MKTDCIETTANTKLSVLARVVCFVTAVPLGLYSVFMTLIMLLASMNIHFSSSPQLGIFLAGWTFVGSAFVATYRLLRRPSFKNLWLLVPPALCLALVQWLGTFPENRNLLH